MKIQSVKDIRDTLNDIAMSSRSKSISMLDEIINSMPIQFSQLIKQSFKYKRVPKEYLLSSILFSLSTSIGTTFFIEALGYKNYANLYFAIIGSRGDAKSEAMKIGTSPIKKQDDLDYDNYTTKLNNAIGEEKEFVIRKQTLIQNATIEAVHKIHSENPNSVGISVDELYDLIDKMGNSNSRDGTAWRTFFLESYVNGYVDVSRKTTMSFRLSETYATLIGGLQNEFVPKLFANGNLESGFIDRLLFVPKLTTNTKLEKGSLELELLEKYEKSIHNILDYKRQSECMDEERKQFQVNVTDLAEDRLFNYTQELINRQEKADGLVKPYLSKMQISIHKFCLVVFMMENSNNSTFRVPVIDEYIVEFAILLNEFYFNNFQIILEENLKSQQREPSLDEVINVAIKNKARQNSVADIFGVNKSTVSKHWKKVNGNLQPT